MAFNPMLGGSQGLGMAAQGGQPDVDPATINALLQQFGGMSVPDQAKPQGMFENAGWMRGAPGLARGLDNAMIAVGNMGPTGRTAGENISNVARGVQSIGPTRNMQQAAQYMLPLQMAGEVAKLQTAQGTVARDAAMAKYYGSRNDTGIAEAGIRAQGQENAATTRAQAAMQGHQLAATKEAQIVTGPDNKQYVGLPSWDEASNSVVYKPDPSIDVSAFKAEKTKSHIQGILGNSIQGQLILGKLGMPPDTSDPYSPKNAGWWKQAGKEHDRMALMNPMFTQGQQNQRQDISNAATAQRQDTTDWHTNNRQAWKDIIDTHNNGSNAAIDNRMMALRKQNPNAKITDLETQARQEENQTVSDIYRSRAEYDAMPPDQQQKVGGPSGFLNQRGFDPKARKFAAPPQTPAQVPQPNAMGGAPQGARGPTLSPNVQAIIDSLKN